MAPTLLPSPIEQPSPCEPAVVAGRADHGAVAHGHARAQGDAAARAALDLDPVFDDDAAADADLCGVAKRHAPPHEEALPGEPEAGPHDGGAHAHCRDLGDRRRRQLAQHSGGAGAHALGGGGNCSEEGLGKVHAEVPTTLPRRSLCRPSRRGETGESAPGWSMPSRRLRQSASASGTPPPEATASNSARARASASSSVCAAATYSLPAAPSRARSPAIGGEASEVPDHVVRLERRAYVGLTVESAEPRERLRGAQDRQAPSHRLERLVLGASAMCEGREDDVRLAIEGRQVVDVREYPEVRRRLFEQPGRRGASGQRELEGDARLA